jgi:zinc finger protein
MKEKRRNNFNSSFLIDCPACGKRKFNVTQRLDKIPFFGEVLETFASCDNCKYKTSDVLPLEEKNAPHEQELKVTNESHLKIRLVKSKQCTIEIPEIGLTIEPGPGAEAFVTNVEGLVDRIEENVERMGIVNPETRIELDLVREKLKKMADAKLPFTLIFRDETGQSLIMKKV